MYSMMANLAHESIKGATREERMEARKAFAGILVTHSMMAGSLTLLGDPLRWIGGAYDWATGAQQPHDYENDARQWISDTFGPELGEVISRGLPHLAGIDIHSRVGLANLLEFPDLKSFDKKGYLGAIASMMTGASGEDAATMAGGMSKMWNGQIMDGLKDFVPRVIRDPMKAAALSDKGVTDSTGKTVLPASKISAASVAAQAAGFQPSQVTEFREGASPCRRPRPRTASAPHGTHPGLKADPEDREDAMDSIHAFNRGHPGEKITVEQLLQQKQAAAKSAKALTANPGSFGLKLNKGQSRDLQGTSLLC